MTITEFGRTVKMNGSHGTDHGYGTATLLAGGLLKEGTVLTEWPGLKNDKLFERRDLMSTVDLRSICVQQSRRHSVFLTSTHRRKSFKIRPSRILENTCSVNDEVSCSSAGHVFCHQSPGTPLVWY